LNQEVAQGFHGIEEGRIVEKMAVGPFEFALKQPKSHGQKRHQQSPFGKAKYTAQGGIRLSHIDFFSEFGKQTGQDIQHHNATDKTKPVGHRRMGIHRISQRLYQPMSNGCVELIGHPKSHGHRDERHQFANQSPVPTMDRPIDQGQDEKNIKHIHR